MTRDAWYAETDQDPPRFAFRKTARGIVRWAQYEQADHERAVRVIASDGASSTLTSGGFWRTTDPRIAAILKENES